MNKYSELQLQACKLIDDIQKNKQTETIYNSKKCKKCNQTLDVIVRQTRKSDEGMTTFIICNNCKTTKKN